MVSTVYGLTRAEYHLLWAQAPQGASIGISGEYRVGPGDVLDVTVFEVQELSGPVVVSPAGLVSLPLIGEVRVAAMAPLEIEAALKRLYGADFLRDPQISVSVAEFRSQPISVVGAVARPGVYQLQGKRRLLEVLAMAGGLAEEAGEEILISRRANPEIPSAVTRGGTTVRGPGHREGPLRIAPAADQEIVVSVRELLISPESEAANPIVEPHDLIRVAKAGVIYVLGAVERPGGFPIKNQEKVTVLRALSLASGLTRRAAPRKARIISKSKTQSQSGGETRERRVRLRDILRGAAEDVALEPNDILFIPDSGTKTALSRGAEAAIQMATGVVIWRR